MRQFTFGKPTTCTHIYQDGREERVRYGQYEAMQIVTENGWEAGRTSTLDVPTYLVTEVVRADGTKVIFDESPYCIHEKTYGDGSGRLAKRNF